MIAINSILVATDFSASSDTAVAYALNFARTFGAKIHLLHVVDRVALYATELGWAPAGGAPFQAELEDDARRRLEALLSDADRERLQSECIVFSASPTAATILQVAHDISADLIVVGTHGRTGVKHVLLGSVAEAVVRRAQCPVLAVHHPEHEFIAPEASDRAAILANQ